jgi:hypothetical protein
MRRLSREEKKKKIFPSKPTNLIAWQVFVQYDGKY